MPVCPSCHQDNPAIARFCLNCGRALGAPLTPTFEERKIVTVLFCDLVGFTAISDNADPEDVRARLRPYHERVRAEIERFGGIVEKFIGDAVMAVWGAPIAHEDDAERAVRSSLQILQAIEELNQDQPALQLAVRIGINTGEAVVALVDGGAEREGMVTGDVVNTAARLEGVAPTGSVVVGEATHRSTKSVFDYEALKPVTVKGKARPLPVWRVRAVRTPGVEAIEDHPQTPFVGRDDELALLTRTFTRLLKQPAVQLVTLMGEPGVGKTRLVQEFAGAVAAGPDAQTWRQGRCPPYGDGIMFWALGEIVKAQAGILESDTGEEVARKLDAAVTSVVSDAAERDWLRSKLAPLVGLPLPEAPASDDRLQTFSAWRRFLEALASIQPLVLVIEDLHWADFALLDFLEYLIDWANQVPILVVCTARPELYERRPGWGGGKRNSATISLLPLTDEETADLILSLLPARQLPSHIHDVVLDRVGGNPLFAEEFARMLAEPGMDGEGVLLEKIEGHATFPESLQAIIAARLDNLSPNRKALLQDSSVIGRAFWSGALAFMANSSDEAVQEDLHELTRREFVRPVRSSSIKDQGEYSFWHSLIRDVAYSQIPRSSRARKHRTFAQWMEGVAGERVADHAEVLAHHYRQALELSRVAGDAEEARSLENATRRFLVLAGDRAAALDAARAADHYRDALRLMSEEDSDQGKVLAKAAEAAGRAGQFVEAERTYREAIERLTSRGDLVAAGDVMVRLSNLLWFRGDTSRCREVLSDAITLLERRDPGPELVHAYTEQAGDKFTQGLLEEALESSERALALAERLGVEDQKPRALACRGMARSLLGDLGGIDDVRRGLKISFELGLGRETARVHAILAELLWVTEGPRDALDDAQTGVDLAEGRGNRDLAMAIRAESLKPHFDLGDWDQLLRLADEVIKWSRATGEGYYGILSRALKAHVLLLRGELSRAAALEESFLPAARVVGEPQVLVTALAVAAVIEHGGGELGRATSLVREVAEMMRRGLGWFLAQHLPDLLRVCAASGDLRLGEDLLNAAESTALRHKLSSLTARAVLLEAQSRLDEAMSRYTEAAEGWSRFGFELERGRCLLGAARSGLQLGRRETAHLEEARSVFRGLGAQPLAEETESWLRRVPAQQL